MTLVVALAAWVGGSLPLGLLFARVMRGRWYS